MTDRALRQSTRTYDGRQQAERIEFLEEEVRALRAELAREREENTRLRNLDAQQRADFLALVEQEMEARVWAKRRQP